MPILNNAKEAIIQESSINSAHTINQYTVSSSVDIQNVSKVFEEHVAFDAFFDSEARFDPPKCHPQTRMAVLDHIHRWATDVDSELPVMWVRGAAGAGKSAISQTLSERWDAEDILAATFFFSRTVAGRNEKKRFVSTLAYQLSLAIPSTRLHIETAIRTDVRIFRRNLQTQIKKLIIAPLKAVSAHTPLPLKVIVIDGLDECCIDYPQQDHENQQKEILDAIVFALNHDGFPLRFLIASRPERQIRESFGYGRLGIITSRITLDTSQNPDADINLFLRFKFDEIRHRHPYLGPSWPPEDTIPELVRKSSGQFIYGAVAMRVLSSPRSDPEARLRAIMGVSLQTDSSSPFAELDALYTHILTSISPQSVPMVARIFEVLMYWDLSGFNFDLFDTAKTRRTPTFIAKYLFTSIGQVYLHLVDLHSILDIPEEDDANTTPISFIHASFSEFLSDSSRSGPFAIDKEATRSRLLSLCLRHVTIQMLSSGGAEMGYNVNGFAYDIGFALRDILERHEERPTLTSKDSLDGLAALVGQDEEQLRKYIISAGLEEFGLKRDHKMLEYMLELTGGGLGREGRPVIVQYLKRYYSETFEPANPEDLLSMQQGGENVNEKPGHETRDGPDPKLDEPAPPLLDSASLPLPGDLLKPDDGAGLKVLHTIEPVEPHPSKGKGHSFGRRVSAAWSKLSGARAKKAHI